MRSSRRYCAYNDRDDQIACYMSRERGVLPGDLRKVDPQFTSTGSARAAQQCIGCNFSINSTSPAKDAGVSTAATFDLKGNIAAAG
jgi:hypothetical protein